MAELTYENMMAVVKRYGNLCPGLTPENRHEMEAICTPDAVFFYPEGKSEAEIVSSHWETYRAHLFYEPWPLCIMIDDKKKMAGCVLREEARHPVTNEFIKRFKHPVTGELQDTIYIRHAFEFTLHDNAVKIKTAFSSLIDIRSQNWKNWRDLAKHPKEGMEKGLTYESMMAATKKFFDILEDTTPENKHELAALFTPDAVYQYAPPETAADHVSEHSDIYRARIIYEPWPFYIAVDERKKMIDSIIRMECRHPVTGELVKAAGKDPVTGKPLYDTLLLREILEFELHDNVVKIKNVFTQSIDPNSVGWQRWRDLAKHGTT